MQVVHLARALRPIASALFLCGAVQAQSTHVFDLAPDKSIVQLALRGRQRRFA